MVECRKYKLYQLCLSRSAMAKNEYTCWNLVMCTHTWQISKMIGYTIAIGLCIMHKSGYRVYTQVRTSIGVPVRKALSERLRQGLLERLHLRMCQQCAQWKVYAIWRVIWLWLETDLIDSVCDLYQSHLNILYSWRLICNHVRNGWPMVTSKSKVEPYLKTCIT